MNNEPKPTKKLSTEEAASEVVQEKLLDIQQKIFSFLEKKLPVLAEQLRPDFQKYIETLLVTMKENPGGNFGVLDVERKIPGNQWALFLKKTTGKAPVMSPEMQEQVQRDFIEEVRKRTEGKDIN
jgi:hypothetical protein